MSNMTAIESHEGIRLISTSGIIVDGESALVSSYENFHENELSSTVSHNGYVYAGGLTIGTTTCSMTVPFDDCNK